MVDYKAEVRKAKAKIARMSTPSLQKALKTFGTDGKRWAREELRLRGIYAKPKVKPYRWY